MTIDDSQLRRLSQLFAQGADLSRAAAECYAEYEIIKHVEAKQAYKNAADQYSAAAEILEEIRTPLFNRWLEDETEENPTPADRGA
jgi:hypothetical protein